MGRGTTGSRRRAWRYGWMAETLTAWWLRLQGWRILARRFRVPSGEIDIVARRGAVLAMIEVKARGRDTGGADAVTPRQRRRIERAAEAFLQTRPEHAGLDLRFDVMVIRAWRPPQRIINAWWAGE